MQWPFKHMTVGEVQIIWDINPARSRAAAHTYGASKGWRFKTAAVKEADGRVGLVVKRLKNKDGVVDVPALTRNPNYVEHSYESLPVGGSVTYADDPIYISRVLGSIQYRERKTGRKWSRRVKTNIDTGQYERLTLTRIA